MIIKVCGMRDPENIREVAALGVDWIGLIFFARSPRRITNNGQLTIDNGGKRYSDCQLSIINYPLKKVGVFVNTKMAADAGMPTLANMILVGKIIKETGIVSFDNMDGVLKKVVSAKKQDLLDLNKKALDLGYNF